MISLQTDVLSTWLQIWTLWQEYSILSTWSLEKTWRLCEKFPNWTTSPTWFLLPATASVVPRSSAGVMLSHEISKASGHWSQHPTHLGIPFQIPGTFCWAEKSLAAKLLPMGNLALETCNLKGIDLGGNHSHSPTSHCGRNNIFPRTFPSQAPLKGAGSLLLHFCSAVKANSKPSESPLAPWLMDSVCSKNHGSFFQLPGPYMNPRLLEMMEMMEKKNS